ncbi:MAG: hypothetical protein LBB45_09495 [Methanobrevibacter sp.]|nr:hypothetical protein [Candidatus Methanovirga basalitermitum]
MKVWIQSLIQPRKKEVIDRKQIAIDFANSLNHPENERIVLFGSVAREDDNENLILIFL